MVGFDEGDVGVESLAKCREEGLVGFGVVMRGAWCGLGGEAEEGEGDGGGDWVAV